MSHQAHYVLEREGFETLEAKEGFVIYKINGPECYIRDIYIAPDFRSTGAGKRLADRVSEIAKERGCNTLVGTVVPLIGDDPTKARAFATESMRMQIAYGFKIHSCNVNEIVLSKEI